LTRLSKDGDEQSMTARAIRTAAAERQSKDRRGLLSVVPSPDPDHGCKAASDRRHPAWTISVDPFTHAGPRTAATAAPPALENDLADAATSLPGRDGARPRLVTTTLASLILHALPVAAFVLWPGATADFGILDRETEAISVEIVSSNVLEALEAKQAKDAAAAQQAVVMPEGNAQEDNTQATPEDPAKREEVVEKTEEMKPAPRKEESAPDEPAPIKVERADAAAEQSNAEREDALAEPKLQKAKEKKQQEEKKEEKKEAAQATRKGGVTVSATEGSKASSPKVSASTGEMRSYAAAVRAHVAAHKPAGGSKLGTVVISFGITHDGRLSFARVNSSSGIQSLDERALAAIRRSEPFPMPPAGATERQLTYSIPIYFK
jgi:periplasmic protein TonB